MVMQTWDAIPLIFSWSQFQLEYALDDLWDVCIRGVYDSSSHSKWWKIASEQQDCWRQKMRQFLTNHSCSSFIDMAPHFSAEPRSTIQKLGGRVQLRCAAEPAWTFITWHFNGQKLTDSGQNGIEIRSGSLIISSLQMSHVGRYQCVASSSFGVIVSSPSFVTIASKYFSETPRHFFEPFFDTGLMGVLDRLTFLIFLFSCASTFITRVLSRKSSEENPQCFL